MARPQAVTYGKGFFVLGFALQDNIIIENEEYLETRSSKGAYYINQKTYGGTENKTRVVVENVFNNFDGNQNNVLQRGLKLTLMNYIEDLHTLTYEPYFFKL